MGEPLLDHNSILVVVLGCFAVLLLRCQTTVSSRGNQPTPLRLLANILLGFAAWMLSVRWMNTQASIAADSRPSLWLSSLLSVACGLSVFFAVKTVVAESLAWRIRHFCATLAGCAAALFSVAFWFWGALLITLSVSVFVLFLRRPKPIAMLGLRRVLRGEPRESGLVTMTGAASWGHGSTFLTTKSNVRRAARDFPLGRVRRPCAMPGSEPAGSHPLATKVLGTVWPSFRHRSSEWPGDWVLC